MVPIANSAVIYALISMLSPLPPIRTIVGQGGDLISILGIGHSTFEVVIQSATLFLKQSIAPASISKSNPLAKGGG